MNRNRLLDSKRDFSCKQKFRPTECASNPFMTYLLGLWFRARGNYHHELHEPCEWSDLKANPSKLLEKYFDAVGYVESLGDA
jgi:hypothetical protein